MRRCKLVSWIALLCTVSVALAVVPPAQVPFAASLSSPSYSPSNGSSANRAGRFLHITDIHPDQYYRPGAKINDACHEIVQDHTTDLAARKKKKKKPAKRAGFWGAPVSVCDSPKHLVSATFDWLAANWNGSASDEHSQKAFDFIIWTGDTARHDIDFTHPRKAEEIFEYNRWALGMLEERFPETPIVPNIGNNDIIPHNIMFPGPNSMTRAYRDIWAGYIPDDQHESFLDGGYFSVEVIPNDLAVLSLNTLFWYDSNAATRGCKKASSSGSLQLDWLAEQLDNLRNRDMQVHLIGHVPPTAGNYFADCYEQYNDIVLRFQDTVVGQHFGHMNIDAMFLQEDFSIASSVKGEQDGQVGVRSLTSDLRKDYDLVPTNQKANLDAYMPFFVGPSIVPTYLPTVRVWTYNNSRPDDRDELSLKTVSSLNSERRNDGQEDPYVSLNTTSSFRGLSPPLSIFQRSHRRPRHHKKRKTHRKLPRNASPHSPSRRNQYLTMLGYSQWVLDLNAHNKRHEKSKGHAGQETLDYHLEYTTYDEQTLWSDYLDGQRQSAHIHRPVPKNLLDREIRRRRAQSPKLAQDHLFARIARHIPLLRIYFPSSPLKPKLSKSLRHLTDYRLPSITIEHVLDLARELAGNDKLWARYERRIYTESGFEE